MKRFTLCLLASLVTGAYWWIVFMLVYADVLFSGDRNPALPVPTDRETLTHNGLTLGAGILFYAFGLLAWRRVTTRGR